MRTTWLVVLTMLATSPFAVAQSVEKNPALKSATALEPQPGPAGQEWWRLGMDPFAGVLQPPPDDPTPEAADPRATDCCPLGGWVQSLGFNPVWAGNVISISKPILLKSIEIEANFNGPLDITYGIYREKVDGNPGDYVSLQIKKVTHDGTGRTYYSSGALGGGAGIPLVPKEVNGSPVSTFFAVAAGWGTASIDFRLDNVDYSNGPAFCAGRVRGSWGFTNTNPPAAGQTHQILGLVFFPTGAVSMRMCFEVPGGACCLGDTTCVDDVTSNACVEVMNGEFLGLFSLCALDSDQCTGFGACCPDGQNPVCFMASGQECIGANTYKGDGTACGGIDPCDETLGACCRYDGNCDETNEYDCEIDPRNGTPGIYQGDGVTCTPPGGGDRCEALGACCNVDDLDICSDVPEDECILDACVNALNTNGPIECPLGYVEDINNEHCPQPGDQCYKVLRTYSLGEPCAHGACKGPVGACCLLGECFETNKLDCENAGGEPTEMGADGWQACAVLPPDFCESDSNGFNHGACCLPNGNCDVLTAAECVGTNGSFQGVGISCSAFICSEGACCYLDTQGEPACVESMPLQCASPTGLNGTFMGTGSTCPSGCLLEGACCLPDGSCTFISAESCAAAGGQYQGDNVACEEAACPIPGSCCVNLGVFLCFEETDQQCAARPQATKFFTPFGSCANGCGNGACCDIGGSCSVTSGPECTTVEASIFTPGGSCTPDICPVRGACCTSNGCEIATQDACTNSLNGVYRGDGVSCSVEHICDVAACCNGTNCTDGFITDCVGLAGEPGELCAPDTCQPGACCIDFLGDGNLFCQAGLNRFECRALQVPFSDFGGAGTTCTPGFCADLTGACCKADGSCEDLTATACSAIPNASFQLGETCLTADCPVLTSACCKPDNTCEELTETECEAVFGALYLSGQDCSSDPCPEFPSACCDLLGGCTVVTETECNAIPGSEFRSGQICPADCVNQCVALGLDFDFDSNGHVDLVDFAEFQRCFNSSNPGADCLCPFDADRDGDIDAADFVDFDAQITGPVSQVQPCDAYPANGSGDFNGDGSVDLRDYASFQLCAGPSESLHCRCVFDVNKDDYVGTVDLVPLVGALSGPPTGP